MGGDTVGDLTVKCLVWDLDETLWQGVLLEGAEPVLAEGTRALIAELDERGILQSIASRNDHDHAWGWLEKLGVADRFVLARIGWGRKSDAVRDIAAELGFALGTMAFVDDQPAERAEVAHHLPEVRCYDARELPGLLGRPEFTPATRTADSGRRREMYQAGFRREAARSGHTGPDDDFLRSLDLVLHIDRAAVEDLERVSELTARTTQMNATGVHHPTGELHRRLADPDHEVLVVTMEDRFGPHGAVGVLMLARHRPAWHLELLATSCRVVSFGTGAVLLRWLSDQAARAGVHLLADFRRTDRNRMMEIAYRFAGFDSAGCACRSAVGDRSGTDLLHLRPDRQDPPDAMTLHAVDLGGAGG